MGLGKVKLTVAGLCALLPFCQPLHGFGGVVSAHLIAWAQAATDGRTLVAAEYAATIVAGQLDAAHTGRLAVFHAGD
jgi:hypothetical protein